ncbi:hypothetical protein RFI_16878 [Reticulomyxa filosa]|uniref:Glucose-6-phosphate 1-epimerase n=1 Tax=Reticulomyxa filosa TaxID=46433 RepID=X6N3K7_RETFI|nr:hypothetical protein RFI_16878 [Reticulomyxa filosa]|eukprot:ETO20339.1 hypothetical protein RFI_16878 [Reticulomyxa filosa]
MRVVTFTKHLLAQNIHANSKTAQFGPGKLKQHGFARESLWTLTSIDNDEKCPQATFSLHVKFCLLIKKKKSARNKGESCKKKIKIKKDNDETRKQWPYKFELTYTVVLKSENSLLTTLAVTNTETESKKSFDFTVLLHTYFRVGEIENVEINGLKDIAFLDKVDQGKVLHPPFFFFNKKKKNFFLEKKKRKKMKNRTRLR